ncbi:helix-turn-helix domain-containing protein [Cohaesibacter marisflavi]|uniref:helix-turn-helix domain-containing protein n=1 Tax=Cohaesibacter marisflavi TaxID=655353 RepID=UPI0029C76695|nr:XRE family transcriptional regulator [Cohaesibacter marisflavi]
MATFGDLLRLARQFRSLTQRDTAAKLNIPQTLLSRLENDLVEPDQKLIQRASDCFNLPIPFFSIPDRVYGPPVSVHTMFRGNKSEVSAPVIDQITAELNIRIFHLNRLLQQVDIHAKTEVPNLPYDEWESAEEIANKVRSFWRVPSGPIKNLTRLIEEAGIIIGETNFNGLSISGVTFAAPGKPPIFLINKEHPADRIRFTLAHELGHLVMHRFPSPTMEDEANQFASALLLPRNEMQQVFSGRKITLELLASLKKEWKASMQSLLMCANDMGFLTPNQNRYLWQQISKRGWRLKEPASLDIAFEPPSVLPSIIKAHLKELSFSFEEVLKITSFNKPDFVALYGDFEEKQPTRPTLRIVS